MFFKFDDTFFLGKSVSPISDGEDSYEESGSYKLFNKDSLVNLDAQVGSVKGSKKDFTLFGHILKKVEELKRQIEKLMKQIERLEKKLDEFKKLLEKGKR